FSTQELRDLGDHRAAVSGMAAKLAAERALPEEVRSLARQVERLGAARTTSERRRADTQFNIEVAAAAQSPRLTQEEPRPGAAGGGGCCACAPPAPAAPGGAPPPAGGPRPARSRAPPPPMPGRTPSGTSRPTPGACCSSGCRCTRSTRLARPVARRGVGDDR